MADSKVQNAIFNTMVSCANERMRSVEKNKVKLVIKKLDDLSNLFDISEEGLYENTSTYYSVKEGQNSYLYRIKSVNNYELAFHLITEILDIIRGEPLVLEVYKIEHDEKGKVSSMTVYKKKESETQLITRQVKYNDIKKNEIHYLLDSLERQVIIDKQYIKHFNDFEKIAKTHFQKHKEESRYNNFNNGHIIEAYKRHLYLSDHKNYSDKITKKHVAIMLYYSMNLTGQQRGGDVGFSQIKGDNTRLATQKSIRMVANKLISMYQNPDTFTPEEFKRMFSINELEEIADYQKLSRRSLKNLLENELSNLNISNNIKVSISMDNKT